MENFLRVAALAIKAEILLCNEMNEKIASPVRFARVQRKARPARATPKEKSARKRIMSNDKR